mmetsp:Transcript_19952/g.61727  ORF Transcript_19952/g.61727 Transcript_19952/m.61727 type:complete len:103 (+) Transcript_19952:82-390(+)|eukprot:CAMPEP_0198653466 /NCGR_PEP_ID=MMETSP1467-20131203/7052_1 /TAXON_ID=1462469 /ORGANISM="unid. sp., Strain CCMP2135" /LENGTH=102 /DNA_ID=CAMNT_0044389427 /DNA_START=90 /DNA_END=398 /DNA_ORIENTATION=+
MVSFAARAATLACMLVVAVNAFAPLAPATHVKSRSATVVNVSPVELAQGAELVSQLPTQLVSLEVTTAAFLAVLLGTFFPVFFLITLYIQSEGYKAGNPDEF